MKTDKHECCNNSNNSNTTANEELCYFILTRNYWYKSLASDGVILQSDHQSYFKTPVCGAFLWCIDFLSLRLLHLNFPELELVKKERRFLSPNTTLFSETQMNVSNVVSYNRKAPQTGVLKYDWWSLCKITPSNAKNWYRPETIIVCLLNLPQGNHVKAWEDTVANYVFTAILRWWNLVLGLETSALEDPGTHCPLWICCQKSTRALAYISSVGLRQS